jgi:hypothetical protein
MYRFDDLGASSVAAAPGSLTGIDAEFIAQQWLSVLRTALVDNIVQISGQGAPALSYHKKIDDCEPSAALSIPLFIKQLIDRLDG